MVAASPVPRAFMQELPEGGRLLSLDPLPSQLAPPPLSQLHAPRLCTEDLGSSFFHLDQHTRYSAGPLACAQQVWGHEGNLGIGGTLSGDTHTTLSHRER